MLPFSLNLLQIWLNLFLAPTTGFVKEHVYVIKEPVDQSAAKFVHLSIPQHDTSPSQNIGRLLFSLVLNSHGSVLVAEKNHGSSAS